MNAIELLKSQHRNLTRLTSVFRERSGDDDRQEAFNALADALVVHMTLEEKCFYPAVLTRDTGHKLRQSVEEHLSIKRETADLLATAIDDESFDAKLAVLVEQVDLHVADEEKELFPLALELLGGQELERLAVRMRDLAEELEDEGSPRDNVFSEISRAAQLDFEHAR